MQDQANTVHIASVADHRYVLPLAVMLRSAEHNLRLVARIDAWIVDAGLRGRDRRRIAQSLDGKRIRLHWLPKPPRHAVAGFPVFGHVNESTYYRLLLPVLLPPEVRKVVYLDADTLVLGDLAELWNEPFAGAPLMAVQDGTSVISTGRGIAGWRELGLDGRLPRLNGGVLVLDLESWRRDELGNTIAAHLRTYAADVQFWDQDGLNAVLAGKWRELDRKWNHRVDCAEEPDQAIGDYAADLKARAGIVHFASATKPWHYYADHPSKIAFFEYVEKTVWKGWRPRPPLRALRNRYFWTSLLRRAATTIGCTRFHTPG